MYIILDKKLHRIGTLSNKNHGGTPFYNDQITQQIADDDQEMDLQSIPDTTNAYDPNGNTKNWGHTLDQIYVPYGYPDTHNIEEGNSLAYQDPNNHRWYVMRLTSVTDATDMSGAHYKEATGVNLCIWKLGKTVHYAETIQNANSNKAFNALLEDTGWYIDPQNEPVGGSSDIQFDGTSSNQSVLQQLCQIYGAEVDAYVLFPKDAQIGNQHYASDFQIALKYVDVERHMGTDTGNRIVYGRNTTGIQRDVVDDNLYTRLYVYGQNGSTCRCKITNNEPYVEDEVANSIYNPPTGDNAENYLEGAITSQTMSNPERLAQWGLKNLKIFNHPRANYTVTVTPKMNAEDGRNNIVMNANIGDTFRVIDYKMQPVLTAESRVIRKQLSFANPSQNQIMLGEYTTVNVVPPSFIRSLQESENNHIESILDEIRHNPKALTCTVDKPNGTTWSLKEKEKRFIAHVYVMNEDITSYIQPKGFVWQLWQNGQINNDFTKEHAEDGQTLILKNDIKIDQAPNVQLDSNALLADNHNSNDNIITNSPNVQTDDNSDPNSDSNNGNNRLDLNNDNIEEALNGQDNVTGEIRLLIDTNYISDKQDTKFNTNRIQHIFTVGEWKDSWGDPRTGALQYINYNPNDQCYYAALVYYGRNRPREDNRGHIYYGDTDYSKHNASLINRYSTTEIARLDSNGKYLDSMILPFSIHNSNFGLDYTTDPNTLYIWTTYSDHFGSGYWIVRLPYYAGEIAKLDNLPKQDKLLHYSEPYCMVNYDNSSGIVLLSHDDNDYSPSHKVEFYHAKDLLNNRQNAKPFTNIELTNYGFVPKQDDYELPNGSGNTADIDSNVSSDQTFQSGCLYYPYYFFDTGDINMSDPRMIYCINIQSGTEIFSKELDLNQFNLSQPNNVIGDKPGDYVFAEPETINWVQDNGNLSFLYGLNVGYQNLKTSNNDFTNDGVPEPDHKHFEQLYKVGFDLNSNNHGLNGNTNNENNPDHSKNGTPNN